MGVGRIRSHWEQSNRTGSVWIIQCDELKMFALKFSGQGTMRSVHTHTQRNDKKAFDDEMRNIKIIKGIIKTHSFLLESLN